MTGFIITAHRLDSSFNTIITHRIASTDIVKAIEAGLKAVSPNNLPPVLEEQNKQIRMGLRKIVEGAESDGYATSIIADTVSLQILCSCYKSLQLTLSDV